jgi:RNA-directed DNA polymerase
MRGAAVISALARSFLAGDMAPDEVHARGVRTLGRNWRWVRTLANRYVNAFDGLTRPRHRDVVRFLLDDRGFTRARAKYREELSIAVWIAEPQRMQPVAAARGWNLTAIASVPDLARWLSVSDGELEWFADLKGLGAKLSRPKLEHYSYRILPKRSGGIRLMESPEPRLKQLQRRILEEILDRIPAHEAVHGFVKGRSIVTNARAHVARRVVLRLDLANFFPAFPAARVATLFRTLGYPETVAARLAGICTSVAPRHVWKGAPFDARELYAVPHLPQGAPTSPALANLMTYRLDCRLSGLAKASGAAYTRYADDLTFSGDETFARSVQRFATHAAAIALEEGFTVNHRKTRIMRQGVRQQVAGVVVNRKTGIRRREFDILKAILTNSRRFGSVSQNRAGVANFRAHLDGRVGFVEMIDPAKGRRLRALFERIEWEMS